MKASSPVYSDVTFAAVETGCTLHAPSRADTAKLEKSIEDRAIISDIELALFFGVVLHIIWCDLLKEIHVFVGMKLGHFVLVGRFCSLKSLSAMYSSNLNSKEQNNKEESESLQGVHPFLRNDCRMKGTHIDFHPLINAIVHNQAVRQPDSMRLHRMACNIGIVTDVGVIKVSNFWFVTGSEFSWVRVERRERRHGDGNGVVSS
jgi:hypothetical protein